MAKDSPSDPFGVDWFEARWRPGQASREAKAARRAYVRAAKQLARHTPTEWRRLREYFGGRCVKCCKVPSGQVIPPGKVKPRCWSMTRDHIQRIVDGGSDGIENIQPMCNLCNSGKGLDRTDHRPTAAVGLGLAWPPPWWLEVRH